VSNEATDFRVQVNEAIGEVAAFLLRPPDAWLLYVLAHGAGAGMRHEMLERVAASLAAQGVATFRYQFPYMEAGRGRPDPPAVLETTVRAAVTKASEIVPELPVVAGGKSLGGRMTSSAASTRPLDRVRGLVFLGFPLHPPGQPGIGRAAHLQAVDIPMLFLQGTRDGFARLELITDVTNHLKPRSTLYLVEGADHSFGVPRKSNRTQQQVLEELARVVRQWGRALLDGTVPA
jgi:uncharacterized protein